MVYVVDSADVSFIEKVNNIYNIQGVTTNPTIITREHKEYIPLLKEIDDVLQGKDFHIQLVSEDYEDMIKEAKIYKELIQSKLHIKIPVSPDGFKAIKTLSETGYSVTATAVCTVNQGIQAALQGADYVAVYINRISNSGIDGNIVLKQIKEAYVQYGLQTQIIGASYKSVHQVTDSILNGSDQVTVGKDLFEKLFDSNITNYSIKQFTKDFQDQYKKGVL